MWATVLIFFAAVIGYFLLTPKGTTAMGKTKTSASFDLMINNASVKYGVEAALIKAIIRQESNFDPNAENPNDPSYGLMQVGLMVAQDFGLVKDYRNPQGYEIALLLDPQTNIDAGTRQLSYLLSKYPFDVAIQMYNVGEKGYNSGYRSSQYLLNVRGYYAEYK
jgi:soluble lytic murein transglycosylase-like protein